MEFKSRLRIEPIPCPRPRVAVRGRFAHAYYPSDYKKWLETFQSLFSEQAVPYFDAPVKVAAEFVVKKPKTTKLSTPKGDIDNYAKSLFDGLTKVNLWKDDVLISSALLTKRFAQPEEEPHISLHVCHAY